MVKAPDFDSGMRGFESFLPSQTTVISMPTITIDKVEYDLDTLPEKAKQNLQMLKITEQEIVRLQAQLAIHQTARAAFAKALKDALPAQSDTISFAGLQ